MGIKGLYWYVINNKFLVPYELKSTRLIIDGNGISIVLSKSSDFGRIYGGDYNLMYDKMYQFFDKLLKADVTPIVILDGRFKDEKADTMKKRAEKSFKEVKQYNQDFLPPENYFFIFKTEIFLQVLKELNIFVCRADFEADEEIIALARILQCPVLSTDFDFCICEDVIFVPWDDTLLRGNHLKCKRFNRERFQSVQHISASVLPLIPVLLNNDHFQMNALEKVMKRRNYNLKPYKRCAIVLSWIKNKDFDTAKMEILTALHQRSNSSRSDIERKINSVVESYTNPKVTLDSTFRQNPTLNEFLQGVELNIQEDDLVNKHDVPIDIAKMFRECRLPNLMLDMLTHMTYNCRVNVVECLTEPSIHAPSKRLLQACYGLLIRNENVKPAITLRIREGEMFEDENTEELHPLTFLNTENQLILWEIFGIDEPFQEILKFFNNDWCIFVLAFIYWRRECKDKIVPAIFHSVLLTAFSLNIAKYKGKTTNTNEETISNRFLNLKDESYPDIKTNRPFLKNILHIHMYLTFKQCLFHTIQIVTLLDLGWEIKIPEFINGSYFHSFFTDLKKNSNFVQFWFEGFESLEELYESMNSKLELILGN